MTRSEIRYALFRCVSGNATPEQLAVLKIYQPGIDKLGLRMHEFSVTWDVGQKEPFDSIITGARVMLLKEIRDESLFNDDGTLKDPVPVAGAAVLAAPVEQPITSGRAYLESMLASDQKPAPKASAVKRIFSKN